MLHLLFIFFVMKVYPFDINKQWHYLGAFFSIIGGTALTIALSFDMFLNAWAYPNHEYYNTPSKGISIAALAYIGLQIIMWHQYLRC